MHLQIHSFLSISCRVFHQNDNIHKDRRWQRQWSVHPNRFIFLLNTQEQFFSLSESVLCPCDWALVKVCRQKWSEPLPGLTLKPPGDFSTLIFFLWLSGRCIRCCEGIWHLQSHIKQGAGFSMTLELVLTLAYVKCEEKCEIAPYHVKPLKVLCGLY